MNNSANAMYALYISNDGTTPVTIGENFCVNSSCNTLPELNFQYVTRLGDNICMNSSCVSVNVLDI